MPPNFCPDCGTPVTRSDAAFCEECGTDFETTLSTEDDELVDDRDRDIEVIDDPTTHDPQVEHSLARSFEIIEATNDVSLPETPGRFDKAFVGTVTGICGFVGYLGGIALWIWAIALMYEHWGPFWGIAGFFTVFLPFVVIVTCFWWGVPQFFLGFLACVSAWSAASSVERSKALATLALLAMLAFGGAAGYVGWTRAHTITAHDIDRLTDDALAVIFVLRTSDNTKDAEMAINTTRARAQLRQELAKFDAPRKDVIAKIVGDYLAYEKSLVSDMVAGIERRIKGDRSPMMAMSPTTRAALEILPERIRKQLGEETEALNLVDQMFGEANLDKLPDNWRDLLSTGIKMNAIRYAAAYEDVMGRPIPSP